MTNKTIAELREWKAQLTYFPSPRVEREWDEILSRAESVEPLAVLADKKGIWQVSYQSWKNCPDSLRPSIVVLFREKDKDGNEVSKVFTGDTYAAAEAKARAYLESLDDKGGR